jgi:hypothetical protein
MTRKDHETALSAITMSLLSIFLNALPPIGLTFAIIAMKKRGEVCQIVENERSKSNEEVSLEYYVSYNGLFWAHFLPILTLVFSILANIIFGIIIVLPFLYKLFILSTYR